MSDPSGNHPRDLLSEYLDDELGLEERTRVDRHLAGCEDCRGELETLRRLARALAEEPVPPVPDDLEARIHLRLDEGTVVRPSRWRFALPATIAATLGAVGLLIALQWREGRMAVPPAPTPAPEAKQKMLDRVEPSFAPAPPARPEETAPSLKKTDAPADAVEKDLAATPEPTLRRDAEKAPAAPAAAVPGGIVGGALGGVQEGATRAKESVAAQVAASGERRELALAKTERSSVCAERWLDSGLRGRWEVPDVTAAVKNLDGMARDVGGTGVWHGVVDGGPYVLAVPRDRFEEVFYALRARGMAGLTEPVALEAGSDCAGISIVLAGPAPASPPPR